MKKLGMKGYVDCETIFGIFIILVILGVIVLGIVQMFGYSARGTEGVAQVKRVVNNTPILCMDHQLGDLSLGVMRGGVGSMSTEDINVYVPDKIMSRLLADAAEKGKLVKITYDKARFNWCVPTRELRSVTVLD